jgi:hypothetical protein
VETKNCIVWGNSGTESCHFEGTGAVLTITYSDLQNSFTGTGNISLDPLFANATGGDFHLKSTIGRYNPASGTWVVDGQKSPAIDAGDPAFEYNNEPLPNGSRINMGAYGNTTEASKGN